MGKWKSKEIDGLPKGGVKKNFLCYCQFEKKQITGLFNGVYIRRLQWMIDQIDYEINTWTHYMELPEPPKEEKNEI